MRIEPLSDTLGAQLLDLDIRSECDAEERAELRRLFCQYHLLLVRGQELDNDDQTRFVGYFGPIHVRADGKIETYVSNIEAEGAVGTGQSELLWHQDGTYGARPGIATSLWAQEVSPDAVPTLFANAMRVLGTLPPDLRARIAPLHAVNGKDADVERTQVRFREDGSRKVIRYEQPIVYETPHSGQKTILVSEFMTSHVVELPPDEGEALLQDLYSRIYADDNVYVHQWQPNDLIIWDNLALHHRRPADMGVAARRLRRQSLDGWYTDSGVVDWPETVVGYAAAK
jgi:alpha-ketoglutarate-dependent taurine dioxygenase